MRGVDVGRGDTDPLRIEPEVGQVPENSAECPQSNCVGVSHTPRAGLQVAVGGVMGFDTEQTSHVLNQDQGRPELADGVGELKPQARPGVRVQTPTLSGGGHVLAGEPANEDVHRLHLRPVNGGDVAKV